MTFFRKVLIGKVGVSVVIMISLIFSLIGPATGLKPLTSVILSLLLLIIAFGLLEFTQIDFEEGLIRKKVFFFGLSFGTWYALQDFDFLTITRSSMHVADNVGTRAGSYDITSRFLVLGMHNSDFSIVIKKGSPEELKEIGKKLKGLFPHLELMNSQKGNLFRK